MSAGRSGGRGRAREALTLAKALVTGGERREAAVAQILQPDNLFQPYTTTAANRYPTEFAAIRDELGGPAGRILSFGCSSGSELLSLHHDFPHAAVHGIDINPLAVRAARKRIRSAGLGAQISVTRAGDAGAEPADSYDVVLALAVFRHGGLRELPESCASLVRFADFERTVTGLADALRPGGLLLIRHSNFRFTDCAVAAGFDLVHSFRTEGAAEATPVYGPDDRFVGAVHDDGLYRKRS